MKRTIAVVALALVLVGCESTYYDVMEKVGVHKRDILIDRIVEAQKSQEEGQAQFKSALEQFQAVVVFDGGELESVYNKLNDEYEDSVAAADEIHNRIGKVDEVATALFDEWQSELGEYTNPSLKRESERELKDTRRRYERLMTSMRRAEKSIDPVLASLKDNVLFLKHNLNARAIASLKGELKNVNTNVASLIKAMQQAIDESNRFVREMRGADDGKSQ